MRDIEANTVYIKIHAKAVWDTKADVLDILTIELADLGNQIVPTIVSPAGNLERAIGLSWPMGCH